MARIVDLRNPGLITGSLRPIKPATSKRSSLVHCSLGVDKQRTLMLNLSYAVEDRWRLEHRVEEAVHLQTTQPNFGGVRWWFTCPRKIDGRGCGRRVGKLYRVPGRRRFACRHCLALTYESCQKSHRHDRLFALVAGEASGEAFEAIKRAFSYQTKEARRRREGPSLKLSDAFQKMLGEAEGR